MSSPSDHLFNLNFGEEATMPSQDNIWRPSFLSSTGHLTVGDSDSLALSVQCAGSVSNMAQRLFARTRQVESLAVEVIGLKQEIKWLKHENKQLHRLAHYYATNMKRKLDQLQESDASNDQPSVPPPSGVLPSTEAPNNHPMVPPLSGALPTAETSHEQPL
ncbi:unnamed protein product [Malus baccata var. baccata]